MSKIKVQSKYISLKDAATLFEKSDDILLPLKQGVIIAYGIYFCPDDEEQGITQSLEDIKISKSDWRSAKNIKIAGNSITVERDLKGHSDVFFYNDIKLINEEFEEYIKSNKKQISTAIKPKQTRQHKHVSNIASAYNDYKERYKKLPTNLNLWDFITDNLEDYDFDEYRPNHGDEKQSAISYTLNNKSKVIKYKRFMDIVANIRSKQKNKNKN